MKYIKNAGFIKAVQSFWARIKPGFEKHGDILLFALAITVLAAILINQAGNKKIGQTPAPSVVFIQWWQDNLEKDTLQILVKEFESLHGDIKIVIKDSSYEDLHNDLFNPSPDSFEDDILALDPLWVPELLKMGIIEQDNEALLLSFINVLFYNVEILKDAEFSRPPKNRTEFTGCLRAVTDREKKLWGLTIDRNSSRGIYDDVFPWIWSSGAQLIKDGIPALTSRQVVDSLSYLASLNREGFIVPDSLNGNKLEDFISGRAAFMIAPVNYIKPVRERMGEDAFDVSSVPTPDNYAGRTFFASASWTVGINSSSAHREEARLFVDFLAEKSSLLSEKARAIPGDGSQSSDPDPIYSKVWDITIAAEAAQDFTGTEARSPALAAGSGLPWTELEEIFREELKSLFEERSSPAKPSPSSVSESVPAA